MTTILLDLASPLLGFFGVVLGIRFTQIRWRREQVSDRYNKAIEHLASEDLKLRIAGIHTLKLVAEDSAREQPAVLEVLSTFVRERSEKQRLEATGVRRPVWADIQAALQVICYTRDGYAGSKADLRKAYLYDVKLAGADLALADLSGADLTAADLLGAYLPAARLINADLSNSNLSYASLPNANLIRAHLPNALLSNACLVGAYLSGADITSANLVQADLSDASLTGAILAHANLSGANFTGADLSRADLTDASLEDATFARADLTQARFSDHARVPEGWFRDPRSGCAERAVSR